MISAFSVLRVRLFLLVLLVAVPAIGLILYNAWEDRRDAEADVRDNALHLTQLAVSQQEQVIEGTRELLVALAVDATERDVVGCNAHFEAVLAKLPQYANLGAADAATGDIFCSGLPLSGAVDATDRTWFQRAVQKGDFAIGDYQVGRITGKESVNFGYPTLDGAGKVDLVVFAALDLVWLNQVVSETELPEGAVFLVIDSSGTILARNPDPDDWVGQTVRETPVITTILTDREGVTEGPGVDGLSRLFAFTPISAGTDSETGMFASIGLPKGTAFAAVNADIARNMAGLAFVALLVLGAGWIGSEFFVLRQTRALVSASRRLAAGDFSARSGLGQAGRGELNELGRTFDEMAASLERRQEDLRKALAELETVNESLEQRVEERTQALTRANDTLQAEIIDRQRAEEELDRFFTLSLDMTCIAGFDGYFKRLNPVWEKALGFTVDELMAQPFLDFVHPEDRDATIGAAARQTEQGLDVISFENRYLCKDGSYRWLLWNSTPLAETQTLYAIARDITERKQAEEALAQQAEALARSNAELDDFTHVVSHDLKEPLRIIEAFSSFLAEEYAGKLDDEAHRYIGILQANAHRMRDLIDDLLQLSRLARVKPERTLVDMAEVISEIGRDMQFALGERKAELRIGPDLPAVECDRVRIRQLFENLISNAIKYNDKKNPVVEVGCRESDGFLTFSVTDNGPGIDGKYHDKIFGIFERLVHQDDQPGTGVGLTICKKIIDMHHGTIRVESEGDGTGTTFLITLPKSSKSLQRKERPSAERTAAGADTTR